MKTLIDHVVDDLLETGLLLTKEAIRDLLTVMSPAQIIPLSSSQQLLIDAVRPFMLTLDQFRNEPIQFLADKEITLPEGTATVAEWLATGKFPVDFLLAALKLPFDVCRWYVLEYLSETGNMWPEDVQGLEDLSTLDTRFTKEYIHEQVQSYLAGTPDYSWISIFGIPDVSVFNVYSTAELIGALRGFLQSMGSRHANLNFTSKTPIVDLTWMKDTFGIESVPHFRPVKQARALASDFADLAAGYVTALSRSGISADAATDNVVAKIKASVIARLPK